jgi:hypothetical protein
LRNTGLWGGSKRNLNKKLAGCRKQKHEIIKKAKHKQMKRTGITTKLMKFVLHLLPAFG